MERYELQFQTTSNNDLLRVAVATSCPKSQFPAVTLLLHQGAEEER